MELFILLIKMSNLHNLEYGMKVQDFISIYNLRKLHDFIPNCIIRR